MEKSMDLLGDLRSTMKVERERELLLYFGSTEVRKMRQRAIEEEGERYIYPQPPMVTAPKGSGVTEPVASGLGETEPATRGSGEPDTATKGSGEPEPSTLGSGDSELATKGSSES